MNIKWVIKNESDGKILLDFFYLAISDVEKEPISYLNEGTDVKWFTRGELDEIYVFTDVKITMDYIIERIIK